MSNKVKCLLLDFDGVISPGRYFSEIYSEKYKVDINKILPFFENKKPLTNTNKADLKDLLQDELETWEWEGTVDELVNYWMHADSDIDDRVVKLSEKIRNSGIKIYLATDQDKYRTQFIWNERGLKNWLDGKFASHEVGFEKGNPEFFKYVMKNLKINNPDELLLVDDSSSKIESAKKVGLQTYHYKDFDLFNKFITDNLL